MTAGTLAKKGQLASFVAARSAQGHADKLIHVSRDPKSGNFGVASLAALGGLAASGIAYVGLSEVSKQFREGTYSVSQKGGPLGKILMGADGFSQMVFGHYAGWGGRNLNGLRVNGEFGLVEPPPGKSSQRECAGCDFRFSLISADLTGRGPR